MGLGNGGGGDDGGRTQRIVGRSIVLTDQQQHSEGVGQVSKIGFINGK